MYKSTGIVRKIDDLGRIVLPSELRKTLDLKNNDPMEFFTKDNQIVLQKYMPGCVLTGALEDLMDFEGIKISRKVVIAMAEVAGL